MTEQQERALVAGLKALAETSQTASASRRVEQAVMEEMRRLMPAPTEPVGSGFSRTFLAAAAALLLFALSGAWLAHQAGRSLPGPIHPAGFVEIPGAAALPPMESGSIVRVALPVTSLPQYGLAIVPDVAGDSVEAELLIAQDGLARAIRLARNEPGRSTP